MSTTTDSTTTTTEQERIARAADRLSATALGDGRWAYYDDATQRYWVVDADDLAGLCDYLDADDEYERAAAYSLWCSDTLATEMPRAWTPE